MAVAIMQFSTQLITAPWLTPTTAQRIAGMLNYFLEHLTGAAPGPAGPLTWHAATCSCQHAGRLAGCLELQVPTGAGRCRGPTTAAPGLRLAPAQHSSTIRPVLHPAGLAAGGGSLDMHSSPLPGFDAGARLHSSLGEPAPRRATLHAGPSRKKLKINNPEKYHWNPLQLLTQICSIYVQLSRGDSQGELARCIAADARCYRPTMFDEAAQACPQRAQQSQLSLPAWVAAPRLGPRICWQEPVLSLVIISSLSESAVCVLHLLQGRARPALPLHCLGSICVIALFAGAVQAHHGGVWTAE